MAMSAQGAEGRGEVPEGLGVEGSLPPFGPADWLSPRLPEFAVPPATAWSTEPGRIDVGAGPSRAPPIPVATKGPSRRQVVVLLPALNEEGAIASVIDRVPVSLLRSRGYDVRVWVVDGRSTDSTLQIARDKGAEVFVQTGAGKGNGVREAMAHILDRKGGAPNGGPRVFVMLDADGTYPAERIPDFVAAVESGIDVVMGNRELDRAEPGAITPLNRLGNRLLSGLASVLYGTQVGDVCTGMWAFREDTIRRLGLEAQDFDLEADLFASSCEIGARLGEFPIAYGRRVGTAKLVPLRTGILIAKRLIMKRLNRKPAQGTRPKSRRGVRIPPVDSPTATDPLMPIRQAESRRGSRAGAPGGVTEGTGAWP